MSLNSCTNQPHGCCVTLCAVSLYDWNVEILAAFELGCVVDAGVRYLVMDTDLKPVLRLLDLQHQESSSGHNNTRNTGEGISFVAYPCSCLFCENRTPPNAPTCLGLYFCCVLQRLVLFELCACFLSDILLLLQQ